MPTYRAGDDLSLAVGRLEDGRHDLVFIGVWPHPFDVELTDEGVQQLSDVCRIALEGKGKYQETGGETMETRICPLTMGQPVPAKGCVGPRCARFVGDEESGRCAEAVIADALLETVAMLDEFLEGFAEESGNESEEAQGDEGAQPS